MFGGAAAIIIAAAAAIVVIIAARGKKKRSGKQRPRRCARGAGAAGNTVRRFYGSHLSSPEHAQQAGLILPPRRGRVFRGTRPVAPPLVLGGAAAVGWR
jgi:hypothetical protein